jgi:BTB/POZ domain-containing adapter for CUL3-mediated RhoA degradation protein
MSAEASGPAATEAPSLEDPKPSGPEPGSAAYCLKPLIPNGKYVKLNVGGSLHYTTLRTLTGQDTMLKAMFSGRVEVLTDAGGMRVALTRAAFHSPNLQLPFPRLS